MASVDPNSYVYFIYSATQLKERTEAEKLINKKFQPGYVAIKGKRQQYTEVNTNGNLRFSDSKIIAEGYARNITFSEIQSL